jgi:hypothetical protein
MYGARISKEDAHAGNGHAGHHRVEHRQQFLQAEEVPGRLGRVGRLVEVGQILQRCVDHPEKINSERRHQERCDELDDEQVRPGVHLVLGLALTSWIEPDFTTVSRRWVCPPGPAASGMPGAATAPLHRAAAGCGCRGGSGGFGATVALGLRGA